MLRKLLIAITLVMPVFFMLAIYAKRSQPTSFSHFEQRAQELQQEPLPQTPNVSYPILDEINKRNAATQTFVCKDVEIKLWENGHRFRLTGELYYEKPKGFRMEVSSLMGKELDLGANDKNFWYWSRRDRRPGLYWAVYEDFSKTRLKTPFNPMYMRSSLGLEVMDLSASKITENDKELLVTSTGKNSMGDPILFSVLINKDRKESDGFIITDPSGRPLVTCEIQEHRNGLPSKVLYNWHEEKRTMNLEFSNPQINKSFSSGAFSMPGYTPKINMADE